MSIITQYTDFCALCARPVDVTGWRDHMHVQHGAVSSEPVCSDKTDDLRDAATEAIQALFIAKDTIKALHGDVAWEIYNSHSPEMIQINRAINKLGKSIVVAGG